ncbi:MAG: crossover junction endodeoxyribonuclease RuvC [Planctomycetota bacterium]|nr:crossover junction endodeoxyribonuclease RuvC [Planctomycetota bacterium]
MRVLGVDPGLRVTGYACLACDPGVAPFRTPDIVEAGVIRLRGEGSTPPQGGSGTNPGKQARRRSVGTPRAASISARLVELDDDFRAVLQRTRPEVVAVESLFAHYKHPATAIAMGHARGVLLLAIRHAGARLVEVRPNEVKLALTGYGHAGKDQMQRAMQAVFGLAELPSPPDLADALAIALCALRRLSPGTL